MKAQVTDQAYGTETNSYTIGAGYINMNNRTPGLTAQGIAYATGTGLKYNYGTPESGS